MKHKVSHKKQMTSYTCGPTCLEMLLDFYNIAYESTVLEEICAALPSIGTENENLARAATHFGARVNVKENASLADIVEVIESGHPVLVNYFNTRSGRGHFGVIKGIEKEALILADPQNGDNYTIPFSDFEQVWHNHHKTVRAWMMHVLSV